jgi:hypothetical protein
VPSQGPFLAGAAQPSHRTRARRPDPAPARTAASAARLYRRDDAKPDHGEESYKGCDKLKGCAAIITGGDSGSGRAVAIAFPREGADVLISYLPEEEDDASVTARWVEQAAAASCSSLTTSRTGSTVRASSTAPSPRSASSTTAQGPRCLGIAVADDVGACRGGADVHEGDAVGSQLLSAIRFRLCPRSNPGTSD